MEKENNPTEQKQKEVMIEHEEAVPKAEKRRRRKECCNFNLGRVLFGILLVFVGIIYFLKTTGIIGININIDVWRLWPLLIVFAGLSMINFRGWIGILASILLTLIVIATIFFAVFFNPSLISGRKTIEPINREISIEKSNQVGSANINIKFDVGNIDIKANDNGKLVSGDFKSDFMDLDVSEQIGAGVQKVLLENKNGEWRGIAKNNNVLELGLDQNIPMSIFLHSGASNSKLDFSNIIAESVDITTGASNLELTMGNRQKDSNVKIDAGASAIVLNLPSSSGIRINIDSGLASKKLNGFKQIDKKQAIPDDLLIREFPT